MYCSMCIAGASEPVPGGLDVLHVQPAAGTLLLSRAHLFRVCDAHLFTISYCVLYDFLKMGVDLV